MKNLNLLNPKLTATLIVAATSFSSSACSASPVRGAASTTTARPAIHTFESDASGFNTKNFFYDNGEQVVVFDTQFTAQTAEKSIEFIRSKTSSPITHVVITHPNPDKFNGMTAFQKLGAQVIASRRTVEAIPGVHAYKKYFFVEMAKMFTEQTYPLLGTIDVVFDEKHDLRLKNGEIIALSELQSGAGVSSNQTIAWVPSQKAVFVGDLVHHRAHAWLEGGIVNGKPVPTIRTWIAGLQELRSMLRSERDVVVYGGRGEAAPLEQAVRAQIAYLRQADAIVTDYVKSLGARRTELTGEQAASHHQALQARFEKAFPGYSLGTMIQYGVYGLVNSK
jgi:glyoxylase-like metal-dependent hydrolase (beta-lactamase superfamily II)